MNNIPKICWVTTDWFVDVDLPIIPLLLDTYRIHWIVVLYKNGRFKEGEFEKFKSLKGLSIEFIHVNQRARHPKTFIDYWKIGIAVIKARADLNYFDMVPGSPYIILPYMCINNNKTVFVAHDGSVKSIMGRMTIAMFKIGYGWHAKYIHMFSRTQAEDFKINYPGKEVTVIPLMPKNYGKPTEGVKVQPRTFLSFGTMHSEKNIRLLIQAAEQLYDEGIRDFKVSICGSANDWDYLYAPYVKHHGIFNLQLRMIENAEIPDLFATHQFVVYPYKMMSQSGALKVAYAYNKPVITSDLPAFKEEVCDGVNGFFFHSEDVESLKAVMRKCLCMGNDEYRLLEKSTAMFVSAHYSKEAVKGEYVKMFNKILLQ